MPHNPMLTVRENFQLDQIRARKDSDPVVSEIGVLTGMIPETYEDGPVPIGEDLFKRLKAGGHVLPNGNIDLSGTFHWDHRIFESNLCPEVLTMPQSLFQHAGHMWLHTHHRWSNSSITGTVELYIPTAEDLIPTPVDLNDFTDISEIGRFSHIAQFVDLTRDTSQSGRNEQFAIYHAAAESEEPRPDPTPEEIEDMHAAMQEAGEGKLDYLLEGTQWDPRNRK